MLFLRLEQVAEVMEEQGRLKEAIVWAQVNDMHHLPQIRSPPLPACTAG